MSSILNNEVFNEIAKMLLAHDYIEQEERFYRPSTGCWFTKEELKKYNSVLEFQVEFPYYSTT